MLTLDTYELSELYDAVGERIDELLLPALTMANRTGDLRALLELLLMGDLVAKEGEPIFCPERVLVVGDGSQISEGKLRSLIRGQGYDTKLFDIVLGYGALKHFNFDRLRNSNIYMAVMVGPIPHSVPGKRDGSSIITQMENHPESYPSVIRLMDANQLKITKSSFLKGLDEFSQLL